MQISGSIASSWLGQMCVRTFVSTNYDDNTSPDLRLRDNNLHVSLYTHNFIVSVKMCALAMYILMCTLLNYIL